MPTGPIFLHSMWRTGSSYLLSRFDADPAYLTFYEPFNGEISNATLRRRAARDYDERHVALGHPTASDGYFARYDEVDPQTDRPLWKFAHASLPLYDVYNGLSRKGTMLLQSCCRVAEAQGRIPVFGFCHSGLQIPAMREAFGGSHIYLSRKVLDQFWSYSPLNNDFFIAATTLQLLASAVWRPVAQTLVPHLGNWQLVWRGTAARTMSHRLAMRLGRQIWRTLMPEEMFALYYLSWLVSNRHGDAHCDMTVSLAGLKDSSRTRSAFERSFGIRLANLSPAPPKLGLAPIDYDGIMQRVERLADIVDHIPPSAPRDDQRAVVSRPPRQESLGEVQPR